MTPRVAVPAEKVRTAEQILAGYHLTHDGTVAWAPCHNCGGSGKYPSSMSPPGMCRFYCWKERTPETYGKLATDAAKLVKRAQAADRAAFRAQVKWDAEAPQRAVAEAERVAREAAEAVERARIDADIAARKSLSQYEGVVGGRMEVAVTVTGVREYQAVPFRSYSNNTVTKYVIRMRTPSGNVLVWFSDYPKAQGDQMTIRATVKKHDEYQGERQTTIQRVKEIS